MFANLCFSLAYRINFTFQITDLMYKNIPRLNLCLKKLYFYHEVKQEDKDWTIRIDSELLTDT